MSSSISANAGSRLTGLLKPVRMWILVHSAREFFTFGELQMSRRLEGLDGLRGIAALIVLFTHTWLIFQVVAGGPDRSAADQGEPWTKAVLQSPLHVFSAGGEAVFVFFILSGFVLTLPFLHGRQPSWASYYPKRLLRLYVPITGAVILAVVTVLLIPRVVSPDQTWWVNAHTAHVTPKGIIREAFTLLGTGRYNTVLWSLSWEIIFSLLLPVYVVVVLSLRRWWLGGTLVMILVGTAGLSLGNDYLQYLPMFGIGAFLAVGKDQISETAAQRPIGAVSIAVAAGLFSVLWSTPGLPFPRIVLLTACTALLIAFMVWKPAVRLSRTRIVYWLGSRSFSLYLVHEPIIVSAAWIFPGYPWLSVVVGWPVVLLLTEAFFRLVEDPSRRLAGWGGRTAAFYAGPRARAAS
jgi:peptidoglycan/LPS O-acetylase OafA/YrhL